jgi:hypothetical protein
MGPGFSLPRIGFIIIAGNIGFTMGKVVLWDLRTCLSTFICQTFSHSNVGMYKSPTAWVYMASERWCSYLTGNTLMGLHGQLRG